MENNYYQYLSKYVNRNKLLRHEANKIVGRNFGTLLLMLLIIGAVSVGVSLVMNFVQMLMSFTGMRYVGTSVIDQSSIIRDYGAAVVEPGLDTFAEMVRFYENAPVNWGVFFLNALVSLVGSMVLQVLYQGYMFGCIRMLRGETVEASCVFSRMGSILRVLGLNLWVGLLCFVWMLPGLVLCFIGLGLAMAEQMLPVAMLLLYGGLIGMIVLGVMALYRYAMAPWALADAPKKGVFQAVARSSEITRGRKFQLFRLTVPHVLLVFLFCIVLMLNIVSLVLQPVFFATIGILTSIIVLPVLICAAAALYAMCCPMALAAFYERNNPERPAKPAAPVQPSAPAVPAAAEKVEAPVSVEGETAVAAAADEPCPDAPAPEAAEPAEPRPMIPAPEISVDPDEPRPVIPAEPTVPLTPVALEDVLPPALPVPREVPEAPIDLADVLPPTLPVEPENPAQPE